jgi:hypothetical protein
MGSLFISLALACATSSSDQRDRDQDDDEGQKEARSTPCEAAYDSLIATGRVVLGMEGLIWGDRERLEFIPLPETRDGSLLEQTNRFHGARGPQDGKDYFDCKGGIVHLVRFDVEGGRFWYDYEPNLPWSKLPLREGARWSWTGTDSMGFRNPDDYTHEDPRLATVQYEVLARQQLDTAIGTLDTLPLRMEWTAIGSDEPELVQTTWFLAQAPIVMVHREQRIETAPGEFIEGSLELISIENPPGE